MHPYIPHLLADMAAAHRTDIPDEEVTEQTIEAHLEEIEKWVRMRNRNTLSDITAH